MNLSIIYDNDYKRTMTAVIFDGRATNPATKNLGGFDLKNYSDSQLALVTENVAPYKILTEQGVVAAVFGVQINKITGFGSSIFFFYRPAFQGIIHSIQQMIVLFIQNSQFQPDVLL